MAKSTGGAQKSKGVTRYTDPEVLLSAVREWCDGYLGTRGYPSEAAAQLGEQVQGLAALADDSEGRRIRNDLKVAMRAAAPAMRDARRYLQARLGQRTPARTQYVEDIKRVVDAFASAAARLPKDDERELNARRLLVVQVDTPNVSHLTNRELAVMSLLGGNGRDWVVAACQRGKRTRVRTLAPTVLDVVRAEEKAIALARRRAADAETDRRAKAMAYVERETAKRGAKRPTPG